MGLHNTMASYVVYTDQINNISNIQELYLWSWFKNHFGICACYLAI